MIIDSAKPIALLLLLLGLSLPGWAQITIQGKVSDAKTGETLPSANILLKDTYRGTITNRNGDYSMSIPDSLLPATVVVRYIGYDSEQRVIDGQSKRVQDFRLKPSVMQLGEITVTDEDPAVRIMREVIRRKQQWRRQLRTYEAEAYTRQTLSSDTSIVMITESTSEAFWDKEKGHREVLKSRRQTANIESSQNFAGVSYLPNFYDDNIDIAGFNMVGVTHPDALKYYDFKFMGQTTLDDQTVYRIKVSPARKLQPLFKGTVYVLDEVYALLEVDLKPNEVVKFPPPVRSFNTSYRQQFNNYGKDFWLPVDVRIEGDVKISMVGLEFPQIKFRQLSRIANYQVNVPLPDSLYEKEKLFTVDTTRIDNDSLVLQRVDTVPLSDEEEQAYTRLDSTATLAKAFKPTGFLARFVDMDDEDDHKKRGTNGFFSYIPGNLSPAIRFNRVDELYAGLTYDIRPANRLKLHADGGYSSGYEEWGYGAGADYTWLENHTLSNTLGVSYHAATATRYQSELYTPVFTIIPNLLGSTNYFDYYRNEGFAIRSAMEYKKANLSLNLTYKNEDHRSLPATSSYDLLGRADRSPVNIPIDEGHLNAFELNTGYNLAEGYPYGATGFKRMELRVEYSSPDLGSDFDYALYKFDLDWNFETFYRRRFLPNTLDLKFSAGTYSGTLPLQKLGVVDAALGYFSPFGSLKSIRNRPYEGNQYISLMAEHNFRTIPFEALGLQWFADHNIGIIAFGGVARTWLSDTQKEQMNDYHYVPSIADAWHIEAGASLNGLFGLFRTDFALRLDEPAFLVNVSVARLF